MGRFDHVLVSSGGVAQRGAELERVNVARKQLELVQVELQPGDVVFFHSISLLSFQFRPTVPNTPVVLRLS